MSEATTKKIVFWADTIFRIGTPIAGCAVAVLLMWLNGKFVTRDEAAVMRAQLQELHDTVIRLERSSENDRRHDELFAKNDRRFEQLDERLRAIETRRQ